MVEITGAHHVRLTVTDIARSREERERLQGRVTDLERRVQVRSRISAAGAEPGQGDSAGRLRKRKAP